MACSTCSSRGLNSGLTANFVNDVTMEGSKGQRYVGLVIPVSKNKSTKLLMGLRTILRLTEDQ